MLKKLQLEKYSSHIREDNYILNSNFLTKLNYKPELNKFETLENQLNKVKLED